MAEAVAVMGNGIAPVAAMAMVKIVKNLYTRLYIYAKMPLVLHKYTAVTPVFRGINPRIFQQTRTFFGVIGAVLGHCEARKSNDFLQNRDICHPFRLYFRLFQG